MSVTGPFRHTEYPKLGSFIGAHDDSGEPLAYYQTRWGKRGLTMADLGEVAAYRREFMDNTPARQQEREEHRREFELAQLGAHHLRHRFGIPLDPAFDAPKAENLSLRPQEQQAYADLMRRLISASPN